MVSLFHLAHAKLEHDMLFILEWSSGCGLNVLTLGVINKGVLLLNGRETWEMNIFECS